MCDSHKHLKLHPLLPPVLPLSHGASLIKEKTREGVGVPATQQRTGYAGSNPARHLLDLSAYFDSACFIRA